jgi:predicted nucleotidyltransferase
LNGNIAFPKIKNECLDLKKDDEVDWSSKEKSVIAFVVKTARETICPEELILFGSRARRDHKEKSDYDFAFLQIKNPDAWARFVLKIEEDVPTLSQVDLVNFDEIDSAFKAVIQKEGVIIHGQ